MFLFVKSSSSGQAGPKAEKRKKSEKRKKQLEGGPTVKGTAGNNPRAFAMQSTLKAKIMNQRKEEKLQKRLHGSCLSSFECSSGGLSILLSQKTHPLLEARRFKLNTLPMP